jgi:beta-galactosidase
MLYFKKHILYYFCNYIFLFIIILVDVSAGINSPKQIKSSRIVENLDKGWKFIQVDSPGAELDHFNDSNWRLVDIPHDWSIEGSFNKLNSTGGAGAFLPSGIGWYRKILNIAKPDRYHSAKISIEFDGVMANSDVWINGYHLGRRPYGYASFCYDLTEHLSKSGINLIAVRVDNSGQPASRWYSGAGIYRHVRLVISSTLHINHWSTFVTTSDATNVLANIKVSTQISNDSDTSRLSTVIFEIRDSTKIISFIRSKSVSIPAHSIKDFSETLKVDYPNLWSIDNPALYSLSTRVLSDDDPNDFDSVDTTLGIRTFIFDSKNGFILNGKNLKIKGVCLHSDGSAFGSAVPLGVWELRLKALKSLGVNAIRTAHNPPSPEVLDLCDKLGFLVMDEAFDCWRVAKNPFDYHLYFKAWSRIDLQDMVLRDRNHPSIILWSTGNEIHDTPKQVLAHQILSELIDVIHRLDSTRPVTQALFRPNVSHDYENGLADLLDVIGTNYRYNELLAAHEAKPTRKIIGTENGHELLAWLAVRDNPQYAGEFIWSGFDYLGESRTWPFIASNFGLLDRTGYPHPDGNIIQSWWSDNPFMYVARRIAPTPARPTDPGYETTLNKRGDIKVLYSDWNPKNFTPHTENLEVYSNCDDVELFLNDKSLGSKGKSADLSPRIWRVNYVPGKLVAKARNKGKLVYQSILQTAGKPTHIKLSTIQSSLTEELDKIICVRAEVIDANGITVPDANNLISFTTNEAGTIEAVDSADNSSHEAFKTTKRKTFEGSCIAYLKRTSLSDTSIIVSASSDGLISSKLEIKIR